jgi:hypothetical protein
MGLDELAPEHNGFGHVENEQFHATGPDTVLRPLEDLVLSDDNLGYCVWETTGF